MQNLIPGVHVSSPALLSFDQSIELRAFLLRRESGNLLIYSTASLGTQVPAVEALGGVARHYLGHWHEAGYGHAEVAAPLGAPLFCHEKERACRYPRLVRSKAPSPNATGLMTTSR